MGNDFWESLARRLVTYAAGALVLHGWAVAGSITQKDIEMGVSLLLFLGNTLWTHFHQQKMKGANETKVIGG